MSVDLSKLSSKELFELAKQREKEEQEATQRLEQLKAARNKREALIAKHEEALAATDKAIRELEEKREKQIEDFEAVLAPLELELDELERQIRADKVKAETATAAPLKQPSPVTAAPAAPAAPAAQAPSPEPKADNAPTPAAPTPQPAAAKPAAAGGGTADELYGHIRGMLRNRTYISESLMKEKLKAVGFDMTHLRKQLDQLIHEKRIDNKGHGNYILGKRK